MQSLFNFIPEDSVPARISYYARKTASFFAYPLSIFVAYFSAVSLWKLYKEGYTFEAVIREFNNSWLVFSLLSVGLLYGVSSVITIVSFIWNSISPSEVNNI